jgi:hypothetical protein
VASSDDVVDIALAHIEGGGAAAVGVVAVDAAVGAAAAAADIGVVADRVGFGVVGGAVGAAGVVVVDVDVVVGGVVAVVAVAVVVVVAISAAVECADEGHVAAGRTVGAAVVLACHSALEVQLNLVPNVLVELGILAFVGHAYWKIG